MMWKLKILFNQPGNNSCIVDPLGWGDLSNYSKPINIIRLNRFIEDGTHSRIGPVDNRSIVIPWLPGCSLSQNSAQVLKNPNLWLCKRGN